MKKMIIALLACGIIARAGAAELNWLTDLPKAEAQAKSENKLVLMNFTGSDWCPACIRLEKDVLSSKKFADYANKNLVPVLVDFPNQKPQSDDLKAANAALSKKYDVDGFPTLVLVKPDGSVVWQQTGYDDSGTKTLIKALEAAGKK